MHTYIEKKHLKCYHQNVNHIYLKEIVFLVNLKYILFVSHLCKRNAHFFTAVEQELGMKMTLPGYPTHPEMGTAFHLISSNP